MKSLTVIYEEIKNDLISKGLPIDDTDIKRKAWVLRDRLFHDSQMSGRRYYNNVDPYVPLGYIDPGYVG